MYKPFLGGRFKLQALLDEKALAAGMAYVDLNPIRAGIADTPEAPGFTSIQSISDAVSGSETDQPNAILPLFGNPRQELPKGLPFRLTDYMELMDGTGRILLEDKRGAIANNCHQYWNGCT